SISDCVLPAFPTRRSSDLRSGLTPGYHYYQVRGVINPDGLDESLLCEGPTETFVVFVLPPLSVAVDGTSKNTDNAFIFCESEGRSEEHTSELQSRENLVCR